MTIYNLDNFNAAEIDKWTESLSIQMALVEASLWKAYQIHCGKEEDGYLYCKKSRCNWPLTQEQFANKYFRAELEGKYSSYKEYKNSDEFAVVYEPDNDDGMCQLYSLLDNFHNYIGAFKWKEYLVVLSVGSSYTNITFTYNLKYLSEGFAVVINTNTEEIALIALNEDDGNYWGECETSYSNLSIFDRGVVSSIVNDIAKKNLSNKDKLIEKILYN